MTFIWKLRDHVGCNVEMVLCNGTIVSGVLISANWSSASIYTQGVPGYDGNEDTVLVRSSAIEYVRKL